MYKSFSFDKFKSLRQKCAYLQQEIVKFTILQKTEF